MNQVPPQGPAPPAQPTPRPAPVTRPPILRTEGLKLADGDGLVYGPLDLTVGPGQGALVVTPDLEILRRLMKCCLAFERPEAGRLSWWPGARTRAGESGWAGYDFFRQIGYVDRQSQLLHRWSLQDHFRFFQLYTQRDDDPDATRPLLSQLGLDGYENTPTEDLPEPLRRLALCALVLNQRPRLMLLERPIQFLDRDFDLVWDLVLDQSRTNNLAVVVFDRTRTPYAGDAFLRPVAFTSA